jgi:hypothetical protein
MNINWDKTITIRKDPISIKYSKIVEIIVTCSAIALFAYLAYDFVIAVPVRDDVVKTLMELNATLLGFFGIIATYIYNSYDTQKREIADKMALLEIDLDDTNNDAKYDYFNKKSCKLDEKKKDISWTIIGVFVCLLLSLVFSLVLLNNLWSIGTVPNTPGLRIEPEALLGRGILGAVLTMFDVGIFMIFRFILVISEKYPFMKDDDESNDKRQKVSLNLSTDTPNNSKK